MWPKLTNLTGDEYKEWYKEYHRQKSRKFHEKHKADYGIKSLHRVDRELWDQDDFAKLLKIFEIEA